MSGNNRRKWLREHLKGERERERESQTKRERECVYVCVNERKQQQT
jgi:hypothetical protein